MLSGVPPFSSTHTVSSYFSEQYTVPKKKKLGHIKVHNLSLGRKIEGKG